MIGRRIESADRRARCRLRRRRPGAAILLAAVAVAAALPSARPATAQTVLAGPRVERDCEAPVIYSLTYVGETATDVLDRTVSAAGADCTVHAASRLDATEAADGPGTWYWAQLPEDQPRYLLLGFHDVAAAAIGWVQLRNTSEAWFYRTNADADWRRLPNTARRVLDWDGVSIALYNPPSEGDWSPLDIWYRFAVGIPGADADQGTGAADDDATPIEVPSSAAPSS